MNKSGKADTARMEDVAREAGVSMATVSRVYGNPAVVAPGTVERVRAAAERLRYVPNLTAGSLAGNRTRIIGAIVPTITNLLFSETIDGLSSVLAERGYQLLLGQTWYRDHEEAALLDTFVGRRVDGIMLTGVVRDKTMRERLGRLDIPVVETWDYTPRPIDMLVGFSNEDAAAAAAGYLLSKGHRRFGYIGGDDHRSRARLAGFTSTLAKARVAAPAVIHIPSPAPAAAVSGAEALGRMVAEHPEVRAIFCTNDMIALGALLECQRRSIQVPRDLAVMGFSNLPVGRVSVPTLTTVHVGAREIGTMAAQMLLERVETGRVSRRRLDVGFSVVPRQSA